MTSARYRSCCKPAPVSDGGEAGERSQVEGSGLRRRGSIAGRGERCQVEGNSLMWRGAMSDGLRWRGAVSGEGERCQEEGSDRMWRGVRWRGAIAGGGERCQCVELRFSAGAQEHSRSVSVR